MGVAFFEKSDVRELLRLARSRGVRVAKPTDDQLNDQDYIESIKTRFGNYPNDLIYSRAVKLAKKFGLTLTEPQRMNHFACQRLIDDCRGYWAVPTQKQIDLLHWLALLKGIVAPRECEIYFGAWDQFMKSNLTRDDIDRGYDALARLQKGGIDMSSYGKQVYALSLAARLENDGAQIIIDRVDELLLKGFDPLCVADDLGVNSDLVYERARHLEAQGHEFANW